MLAIVGVSVLVHAGLSAAAVCAGAPAKDGSCSVRDHMMLQANTKLSQKTSNPAPSWWAPPDRVAEDDRRYRAFVNELLQTPVQCESECTFRIQAKAVDSQHSKLFALADEVRELLRRRTKQMGFEDGLKLTGKELQPLKTLLVWLRQYTVVHFDAEEKTMQEVNYMDMEGHKALHRAFYGHVMMWGEIVDTMMELDGSFHVGNVFVMVAKWLQDHVCWQDKMVGKFVERSALKDAINGNNTPEAVPDTMPDCVPALVGGDRCIASLLQGVPQPLPAAPEWWAPAEVVAAHDFWYRAFVTSMLQSPILCDLAHPFDIAVRAVDAQHHKLLGLVDSLRWLLLERVWRLGFTDGLKLTGEELRPLGMALVWLKQYGVVHFDNEEHVMDSLGYPEVGHHKSLHRAFYGQMMMASEVVDNIMSLGGGFHVGPIYVYMAKWIQDHVCILDKNVGKFIGSSGVELNETEDIIPDISPSLPAQL